MIGATDQKSSSDDWAAQQWGTVKLGDQRRAARAVRLGAQLAAQPDASLPQQTGSWADLKAAYRLLHQPSVTHSALSEPHCQQTRHLATKPIDTATRQVPAPVVLFLQDATELDFSAHPATSGLGHIGDTQGRGFMLHNCLAVVPKHIHVATASSAEPSTEPQPAAAEVLGLAMQHVWTRTEIKKGRETRTERGQRHTEYDLWADTLEQIGAPPVAFSDASDKAADRQTALIHPTPRWISVGDRGSDVFSYLRRARALGWDVLVRLCQDRGIVPIAKPEHLGQSSADNSAKLLTWARTLPAQCAKSLLLRGRDGAPKRTVDLRVAYSAVTILPPRLGPERKQSPVSGWVIRCWESERTSDLPTEAVTEVATRATAEATEKPKAVKTRPKRLEWLLFTSVAVNSSSDALEQIDWYTHRWLIEEYHKCLKTGCGIEMRQLSTAQALTALLGFLAVVAVRLLQLRQHSRLSPESRADEVVPTEVLTVLGRRLGWSEASCQSATARRFWHGVAQLGGFLARRGDGEPGWQTLWRGWQRLQDLCWGARLAPIPPHPPPMTCG